ncbi:ammonium transporter [Anabaena sp. UHCC 0399]|uniref:ammonium transporter n=1 Tax=Anabaena sp. UHCC 0399 TaxID=3110238 RepID=UPI002B1FAF98|nr:ammonium transporter [Anabaena sp. UHCC 0399]MEA5568312.1 ammonium transporter [Anabaena sp. UHCC 0399]
MYKHKSKIKNRRFSARNSAKSSQFNSTIKLINFIKRLSPSWQACLPLACLIVLGWGYVAVAQAPDAGPTTAELKVALDTLWVAIAAFLVFFMNAGFGMLETGFCRQKNAVNVLAKNLIVFALATVAFWVIGFGLMFGDGNDFIGLNGFFLTGADNSPATGEAAYKGVFSALSWAGVPLAAKFLFQLVFAGTAATIVSGAVAERIKFLDFLIFSILLVGIAYPITGHWIWGAGWLADRGFWDFAGSTVVHSVGGWAALMGAAFLGPRIGKYQDGKVVAMPGHNMSIATLGCLILWLGWFGFNPGSVMAADPNAITHIALTTNMAGAVGGIAATATAWLYLGKPDLSMIINGILAGLVAITAPCAYVSIPGAVIIGLIAGVIVVFSVTLFDKIGIDDPVGATSVHLVCGIFGTLAVGLWSVGPGVYSWYGEGLGPAKGLFAGGGLGQLGIQFLGVISVGGMTVLLSSIFWLVLKYTLGIRVTRDEELEGLDIHEHGMEAYSGFLKENSPSGFTESGKSGGYSSGEDYSTKI